MTWGRDHFFYKTGNYRRPTNRQAALTNRHYLSIFHTHPAGPIKSWSQDPESGSIQHYKPPLADKEHHLSLQRCQLHIRETFYISLGYFWFFIEFNTLICIMIGRLRRTHLNQGSPPALQPAPQQQPQPALRRRRPHTY